jgi:hypothetical protein
MAARSGCPKQCHRSIVAPGSHMCWCTIKNKTRGLNRTRVELRPHALSKERKRGDGAAGTKPNAATNSRCSHAPNTGLASISNDALSRSFRERRHANHTCVVPRAHECLSICTTGWLTQLHTLASTGMCQSHGSVHTSSLWPCPIVINAMRKVHLPRPCAGVAHVSGAHAGSVLLRFSIV